MSLPQDRIDPPPDACEITDVQLQQIHRGRLKAFATVVIEAMFVVRGIKIIEGRDRLFVAMPSRKMQDGSFQDIAHPSTQAFRDYLEKFVIQVYKQERNEANVPAGEHG